MQIARLAKSTPRSSGVLLRDKPLMLGFRLLHVVSGGVAGAVFRADTKVGLQECDRLAGN